MKEMKNKGQVFYTKSKGSKGTSSVGYPPRIEDTPNKGQMTLKLQKKNSKTNFQG
jgi:hypothetical protein